MKKFVIATHVHATGPAQDLQQYLISERAERLLFMTHPLWIQPHLKGSGYEYYEQGQLKRHAHGRLRRLPDVLAYLHAIFLNIYFVIKQGGRWDVYVGCNNLNALSGIVLQRLGIVKKTIYYTIDYNPVRFKSRFLNYIYHRIDQFCTKYATETWNTTHLVEKAREEYYAFHGGRQKVVPIGIWFERFERVAWSEVNKHTLVFLGSLVKRQGIQDVIAALPLIINKIPDFNFLVIGAGAYAPQLVAYAKELGIEKQVTFTGYIENHEDVERMLVRCAAAIVMYQKHDDHGNLNFIHFGDPGKIKSYLASGLPIIMNDFAFNAHQLEKAGCAVVVDNQPKNIARAVTTLLSDEPTLLRFREQAVKMARQFDWRSIFSENVSRVV